MISFLKKLKNNKTRKTVHNVENIDIAEFNNVIAKAQKIKEKFPETATDALLDLIRIIMRKIQSEHMLSAYTQQEHGAITEINYFQHWFGDVRTFYNYKDKHLIVLEDNKNLEEQVNLKLGFDIVLPTAWSPNSIYSNLGVIGTEERKLGQFRQDTNHSVEVMMPMRIGFVSGGNHSISQGVVTSNGVITPSTIIDVSKCLEVISFDGLNWIDNKKEVVIGKPRYKEFGWVWEISKLL